MSEPPLSVCKLCALIAVNKAISVPQRRRGSSILVEAVKRERMGCERMHSSSHSEKREVSYMHAVACCR